MEETKKKPGRPKKDPNNPSLQEQLTAVKKELDKASQTSQQNYAYAQQAHKEATEYGELLTQEKAKLKDVIDSVSYMIDTLENTIKMLRKALERDLIKQHTPTPQKENR